ncbi:MAG: dephospho-CoA kinase [Sediminicola sp.]|tara:strand:+ start:43318 stop:43920 length:603 start_codon:yes stop_codon:yes gene_type:complete
MMVVGLTGGIGSGKSTVAKMFGDLGVPVYDSDREAKKIMASSNMVIASIKALLGDNAYNNGQLDTQFIAQKVFADKNLLQALNRIVHPAVKEHFRSWALRQKGAYVVQEAAVIFENGTQDRYDRIILVKAPEEVRIKRVLQRDGTSREAIEARIQNQWNDADKEGLSHFVINNVELGETRRQVAHIHGLILKESAGWDKF